jgi:hypothetical protein
VEDLTRAKNRLAHFLLRHGRVWQGPTTWTFKYRYWLGDQNLDEAAPTTAFARYRAIVECREAELEALEADLACYLDEEPFATPVRRLPAHRGVDRLGALVLQAEVCDWRRFANSAAAGAFCGLVPPGYSSGEKVQRGSLPHAGNADLRRQLIESAWAYTTGPSLGPVPGPGQAQAGARRGGGCHRPRAHRPPLRRDGRVVLMALRITYADLGPDYFQRRVDPERERAHLVPRLEALGYSVNTRPAA